MPRNIAFTPPADEKVKDGSKFLTARFWRTQYGDSFKVGDRITLSTGRKRETRFAEAEIKQIVKWDGKTPPFSLNMSHEEIAAAEGFKTWYEFHKAYIALNKHNLLDPYEEPKRSHYFIKFELL